VVSLWMPCAGLSEKAMFCKRIAPSAFQIYANSNCVAAAGVACD
jgi:hypothetical protein